MSRGLVLAEELHIVNLIPAIDISAGKTGDVFSMKNFRKASIIVTVGVSAAAFTKILINACDDFAGTNPVAQPFSLYKEETSLGDTLTAREAVAAAGYTPSANDNIMYVIELDSMDLPDDKPFVQLSLTSVTQSVIASAIAILSGARYVGAGIPLTAII